MDRHPERSAGAPTAPAAHPTGTRRRLRFVRRRASPMPTQTLTDRDALLGAVRAANLLTERQLAKADAITENCSVTAAAANLVAAGLLTRFQADRLLAGRTDGFQLGQYVILDQIGRGALSRVYKARHRTMNRFVAVKVLSAELTRTPDARRALQAEARNAGRLAHPNVATAYDANELFDRFYFVLEFVDGPNLAALVERRGPLPVEEACEFVRQTAVALQHAHERGLIHRNLKPTNVLVGRPTATAPALVKVTDFGLPRVHSGAVDFA
ncbi:MAG: serine/threonine protein kinase, partial [Gemmataceae bacterium]|nr:serine/threonine protein kinase [Gemmataceae bacterium]